ncbi:MAG: mercuric transporter MerT family protein [Pseudomonadota bacterium]
MRDQTITSADRKRRLAATGGVLGAVLASSCCIGPLVLISLGVSGAWVGNLTALKEYQPFFVVVTIGFIGYGFWRVYGNTDQACDEDACATPTSNRIVKVALWVATALVVAALTTNYWAPLFY